MSTAPEIINGPPSNYEFNFLDPVVLPIHNANTNRLGALLYINYDTSAHRRQMGWPETISRAQWDISDTEISDKVFSMLEIAIPGLKELLESEIEKQQTINCRNKLFIDIMQPIDTIANLDESILSLPYFQFGGTVFVWRLFFSQNNGLKYRIHALSVVECSQWWNQYLYSNMFMFPLV